MKQKVSFYVNVPNLSRVRTRVDNPSKEFTPKFRAAVSKAIVEVVNESTLELRAKLIQAFSEGENPKAKAAAQITGVLNSYFDVFASETPFTSVDVEDEGEIDDTLPENPKVSYAKAKAPVDDFTD